MFSFDDKKYPNLQKRPEMQQQLFFFTKFSENSKCSVASSTTTHHGIFEVVEAVISAGRAAI